MVCNLLSDIQPKKKVINLFCEIVRRVYNSELTEYDVALEESKKKIKELKELRLDVAFKHAKGTYTDEVFTEMNKVIETDITVATMVNSEQKIEKIDIETLMEFAKSLFSDLPKAYKEANALQKKVLIGSIIPDSLVYSETGLLNRKFSPLYQAIQSFSKPLSPSWVVDGNQIEPFIGDISRLYSTFS